MRTQNIARKLSFVRLLLLLSGQVQVGLADGGERGHVEIPGLLPRRVPSRGRGEFELLWSFVLRFFVYALWEIGYSSYGIRYLLWRRLFFACVRERNVFVLLLQ